jgi:putative ABC transport system ATP-binding protein
MKSPLLTLDGISMTYGAAATAVHAIRDVSLDIYRGEVLLMMGPSGSGKTTLLQIIGALLQPTAGSVAFEGRRLDKLSESALSRFRLQYVGFVFQSYNLVSTLKAWENVAIVLELQGVNRGAAEQRSRMLLDYVGLSHRIEAYPDVLSGGEKQRVAIARAIAGDPHIVLADEPTAALDAASGARIAELLKGLALDHDRAVVVVTHDPRLTAIGNRMAMLEDGRMFKVAEHSPARRPQRNRPSLLDVVSA